MYNAIIKPYKWAAAAASLLLIALVGSTAMAHDHAKRADHPSEPRFLSGTYGFSLTQTCARTAFLPPPANGFDPVTKQLLVNGEFVNGFGSGVLKFERSGIATIENALITEISASQTSAGQTPVSAGTRFSCAGTYTLGNDNKLNVSLTCDAAPPQAGLRVVIDPVKFEGFLSNHRTLNLGTFKRELQTVTVYSGNTALQQRQRICLQTLNLDRI